MSVIKKILVASLCFVFAVSVKGAVVVKNDALAMNSFAASKSTPRSVFVFRMNKVLDNVVSSVNLRVVGRASVRSQPAVDLSISVK